MPTADMDMAMMAFTARYSSASAYSRFLRVDLLNALLPKGSAEFKRAVKERCALLVKQAEVYEEAGVAEPLVQGLAQKTTALLLGV